jgi:hypothetical protein
MEKGHSLIHSLLSLFSCFYEVAFWITPAAFNLKGFTFFLSGTDGAEVSAGNEVFFRQR